MRLLEQLHHLARQFPHSRELAITPEMAVEYRLQMAAMERLICEYAPSQPVQFERIPLPDGGKLIVHPGSLAFRGRRLVTVTGNYHERLTPHRS